MARLYNPYDTFYSVWRSLDLVTQIAKRSIQSRYRGTAMGLLWVFVTPLCLLAVYTFVFSIVFKARWGTEAGESKTAFALTLLCGLAVFNIFSESINGSVAVIVSNPNYTKKVVFPLELLPLSQVLTASSFGIIWLAILLAGIGVFMQKFCLTSICLPLMLLPLVLMGCGCSWLIASLGVFFRDIQHVVAVLLQILLFVTPIFYPLEMVPEPYQTALWLNPLTTIVQNVRSILIFDRWPEWRMWGLVTLLSLLIFQLGYAWFMKTKRGFADVL